VTDRRSLLEESLVAIERLQSKLRDAERGGREPIAIIGVGCRYPGGVDSPDSMWRVLGGGVDVVCDIPADRWDADAFYDPDPSVPGRMNVRRGGFLGDVSGFDPQHFGISPREAAAMDPQQRLLLEVSLEAFERAGIPVDGLAGTATGVFVGITTNDYARLGYVEGRPDADVYAATGTALNAAAGRISFTFGLQGPCVAVDTACSSSLVAVHLACRSLRNRESDLALAAGVNVVLSPEAMILFSKWGMLAPDGRCKTFDAAADGFVRAEGCAAIALKRLSDAVTEGLPVLAVIRGSAVNSDGRSSGLTVPNGIAQQKVIRKGLDDAGVAPADIDYVEAHGTGTSLGDPIEVEALGEVMREGRDAGRPLRIGSVKTNFGHTEAASGLAGLLKVVLSLDHETIPPHLHLRQPNPSIPWDRLAIEVPTCAAPWPRGARVRRAGVSSFGFSGTNAHVVLEEAPARTVHAPATAAPVVVALSARTEPALRELAGRYAEFVEGGEASLADIAVTAGAGRTHHGLRAAVVASTHAELAKTLHDRAAGASAPMVFSGTVRAGERPRVAFVFTGQGAQYPGMMRGLYDNEPVFRDVVDRADAMLGTSRGRRLLDVLYPADDAAEALAQTGYTQPALFAVEVGLAELWRSWGVEPAMVLGHSVGEFAAACIAGALSFEDAFTLVAERGRLMQALPRGGAMAAVFAGTSVVEPLLVGRGGRLALAAVNGDDETVISGDERDVDSVIAELATTAVQARRLDVSHAFHSPLLDPMLDAFERAAAATTPLPGRIALVSNVSGRVLGADEPLDAGYWRRHAREPVRFAACVRTMLAAAPTVILEIGPHPTLLSMIARDAGASRTSLIGSVRRGGDDLREMATALARLHVAGVAVRWDRPVGHRGGRRIPMPTYPFQRTRYWKTLAAPGTTEAADGHPLLGTRVDLASTPTVTIWSRDISLETHPWIADHAVQGTPILPATAYVEMAIAAASAALGMERVRVSEIHNLSPILLLPGVRRRVQATLQRHADGSASFSVHGQPASTRNTPEEQGVWIEHMSAKLHHMLDEPAQPLDRAAVSARCDERLDGGAFYAEMHARGNQWGPRFRGTKAIRFGRREAIARIEVPDGIVAELDRYRFHPAVSDASGHVLAALVAARVTDSRSRAALIGEGVSEARLHRRPGPGPLWAHAVLRDDDPGAPNIAVGDVRVYDEAGALVSEALGARLWYLEEGAVAPRLGVPDEWFHVVGWECQPTPSERSETDSDSDRDGAWIVYADREGVAAELARLRRARGDQTILVEAGQHYGFGDGRATVRPADAGDHARLLSAVPGASAVVQLWGGERHQSAGTLALGPEALPAIARAIRDASSRRRLRLWCVTRDAQAVQSTDSCDGLWSAGLWGMGRSLAAEAGASWGGLIDIAKDDSAETAARLLHAEISGKSTENLVAFRGGQRYVARLAPRPTPGNSVEPFAADPKGTYLVTGGLGGIGSVIAEWLIQRGARHLLLVGRSSLPPSDRWGSLSDDDPDRGSIAVLERLTAAGARVEYVPLDVTDEAALQACVRRRYDAGEPPIAGIVHAAGTLHFQGVADETVDSVRMATSAKTIGAWALHRLALDASIRCFVLCSSTSTMLDSPLLGAYAAGNAFLDALAQHRRSRGLSALSVNWGTWSEVGMATRAAGVGSRAMLAGVGAIRNAAGLAALGELLQSGDVRTAVMPVDWAAFARAYPAIASAPFLAARAGVGATSAGSTGTNLPDPERWRAAGREAVLAEAREYLVGRVAEVLGLARGDVDPARPLVSFGFDSLMAVQLRNRIELEVGVSVPMMRFLHGPSIEGLAPVVVEGVFEAGAGGSAAAVDQEWEEGVI
jgi:acyl transferase domain-containing protein